MSSTIVLISGANRGLGKGLLERYLARPDHIIIAANRNPEHATSKDLDKLPKGSGSRLIVVKVDGNNDSDSLNAAKELKRQGIDHLDIVIANAGVFFAIGKVSEVRITDIQGHFEPNVYGVVRLYQAMLPLLLKSCNPKWITIGSGAGHIEVCSAVLCFLMMWSGNTKAVVYRTRFLHPTLHMHPPRSPPTGSPKE